ncbi:MAG: translation elongation factor Ts [Candidatus Giovannonibacteria bacterium]|nr:translation elongation factor Ts [Candidatus Giovannonibacteria bacterium]
MNISSDLVKRLRQTTGASIMLCKKVLEDAGGDLEKALALILKSSEGLAAKKSERKTGAGVVESYIHAGGKVGVMLELRCETDFVARNPEFKSLAHELALHIAGMDPEDIKLLLAQPYVKDQSIMVEELIKRAIAKFGEKIEVARFVRYEI